MIEHKHCILCEQIIIPSRIDEQLKDISYNHPTLETLRWKRDVAYGNSFCEQCINEYGLDSLAMWWKNEITYEKLLEFARKR